MTGPEAGPPTEETGAMDQVTASMEDVTPPESPDTPQEPTVDETPHPELEDGYVPEGPVEKGEPGDPVADPTEPIVVGSLEFKRHLDGTVKITRLVGGVANCIGVLNRAEWIGVVQHLGL